MDNEITQLGEALDLASRVETLGIVAIFFIMLAVALITNYFLFKHAMANCGGMREIQVSLDNLNRAIEKLNDTQCLSIEIIREFSDRETKQMRESLERETATIKEFFGGRIDALYSDSLERLNRIERALIREGEGCHEA